MPAKTRTDRVTLNRAAYHGGAPPWHALSLAARPSLPLELTGVLGTLFTLLGLAGLVASGARMGPVAIIGPLDTNLLLGLVWLLIGLLGLAAYTSIPPATRTYLRGVGALFVLLTLGGLAAQPAFGLLPLGGVLPLHAAAALAALYCGNISRAVAPPRSQARG